VSIVTRRAGDGPAAQGRIEGGWPGNWRGTAIHSQRFESGGYTVYAGGEQSQGFALSNNFQGTPLQPKGDRINSDRQGWFAGGSAVVTPAEKQEVALSANYVDGDKGVPPSTLDGTPRYWRFNVWRGLTASLGHAYRGKVQVEELAYARLYDNLLDGYDDATFKTQNSLRAFHTWYHDRSFGLILKLRAPLPEVLGISSEVRAFANIAYDRHTDAPTLPAFQRVLLTGAPELSIDFTRRLTGTLGCQVDAEVPIDLRGESTNSPVDAGPLVALRYDPIPAVTIGATVALRHRFPSLKERFSRGLGTLEPNPNLKPEGAWHFDLEASWRATRWLSIDVSGFDAEVSDLIEQVYLGSGISQLQNISRARLAGAEVAARVKVQPWLRAELGYAYQFARQFEGVTPQLAYRPTHKVGAGLIGTPWRWLEVSTFVRYIGDQAFQNPTTLAWGTLTGYTVWDAGIEGRPWDGFALYARVTNILDTFYQTQYGFPDPGRRIWVGLRLAFDQVPTGPARSP
jgi:iron complex outermembrane receptor protein